MAKVPVLAEQREAGNCRFWVEVEVDSCLMREPGLAEEQQAQW